MEISKLDANKIRVVKTIEVSGDFDYDYLVERRAMLVKQAEQQADKTKSEIAEIDTMLAECKKLSVGSQHVGRG